MLNWQPFETLQLWKLGIPSGTAPFRCTKTDWTPVNKNADELGSGTFEQ